MVHAIIWKGKGVERASWYQPVQFKDDAEFDAFKAANDDTESKYWTYVERIIWGQKESDTPYNDYSGSLN